MINIYVYRRFKKKQIHLSKKKFRPRYIYVFISLSLNFVFILKPDNYQTI